LLLSVVEYELTASSQPALLTQPIASERKRKAWISEVTDESPSPAKRKLLITFSNAEKKKFLHTIFNPYLKELLGPFVPKINSSVKERLQEFRLETPFGFRSLSPTEVFLSCILSMHD
jgi:hypothetical protein